MADLPTPRSYFQILGEMVDTFLSRFGAKGLKTGGPILSTLESAAQSDARDTQELFNLLRANGDLNAMTGGALDRYGASRGRPRQGETASRGKVTVSDTSFTKKATQVYTGMPQPLAGSQTIYVKDASSFPATGKIYVGRGTLNLEGPLDYTSPTSLASGQYWSLSVPAGTQRFHDYGESVVLAQGGNRLVRAGQVVQTPTGNAQSAVSFSVLRAATLLDGETEVTDVEVVCQRTGTIGNVGANTITAVASPAFVGMAVTNPLPFTNALARENDDTYRDAIRAFEQSRSRGTDLAIKTGILGKSASDEAATVSSASVVRRTGEPGTVYLDDGTGYEDKSTGVAVETVVDSASGGERDLFLSYRPIARATIQTTLSAPFTLAAGALLAVKVGGVRYEHVFDTARFRNIGNASAYEVASSINADPNASFSARTAASGTQVAIFAKTETNDDIEVVAPLIGTDANTYLGFPTGRHDTVRLYRNDQLLYKDGLLAQVSTAAQSAWSTLVDGETLILSVDGTSPITYTFTGADFVTAATGDTALSESNSLASWAKMFNTKLAGVTATVAGSGLVLTSNLGRHDRAAISISAASSLVQKGMFNASSLTATGKSADFVLDRQLSQLRLSSSLTAGETLAAGTEWTNAYLESTEFGILTLSSTANLWFVVDGAADLVTHEVTSGTYLRLNVYSTKPTKRWTAYSDVGLTTPTYPFKNVRKGDWVIVWDLAVSAATGGAYVGSWRVSAIDPAGNWFETDSVEAGATTSYSITGFVSGGITFVRTTAVPQKVSLAAGQYSSYDLATALDASLGGASAIVFQTNKVRVYTHTYGSNGQIMLATADTYGKQVPFTVGSAVSALAHIPYVESGSDQLGVPSFSHYSVTGGTATSFVLTPAPWAATPGPFDATTLNDRLVWWRPLSTSAVIDRWGPNQGHQTNIDSVSVSTTPTVRSPFNAPVPYTAGDNYLGERITLHQGFSLGAEDRLSVTLDGDATNKAFSVPLYRRIRPSTGQTYGASITFDDLDNLLLGVPQPLGSAFGSGFDWRDFAVHMKARAIIDKGSATLETLYRWKRFGKDGELATVAYGDPTGPGQAVSVTSTPNASTGRMDVLVRLPTGAKRTTLTFQTTDKILTKRAANNTTADYLTLCSGFVISQLSRTVLDGAVTVTVTMVGGVTDHGLQVSDAIYVTSTDVNFSSGYKTITGRTANTITYGPETGAIATVAPTNSYVTWTDTVPDYTASIQDTDYVDTQGLTGLASAYKGIFTVVGVGRLHVQALGSLGSTTAQAWTVIGANTGMFAFPVDSSPSGTGTTRPTAASIATAVNALTSSPVTATICGTGAGTIAWSHEVTYLRSNNTSTPKNWSLIDGVNWVRSTSYAAGNFTLTLKQAIGTNLTAPNDFANEELRLVPAFTKNLVDFMSNASVTGFGQGAGVLAASSRSGKLQLASTTLGSGGSLQVTGGTGNSASAHVVGSVSTFSTNALLQILTREASGFAGGGWVSCDNGITLPKQLNWGATTTLTVDQSTGAVTVGVTGQAWNHAGVLTGPLTAARWLIERHGQFVAYVLDNPDQSAPSADFSSVNEGDYVEIATANGAHVAIQDQTAARDGRSPYVVLRDGTVLAIGTTAAATCEIYDPRTETWSATDAMPAARVYPAAALMGDGRVIVTGGTATGGGAAQTSVYIYDPAAPVGAKWSTAASMLGARSGHICVYMPTGNVLVAGGSDGSYLSTAEIYSPGLNSWRLVGNAMTTVRYLFPAILLGNGNVLMVGGQGGTAATTAELFSPTTETFTATGATGFNRNTGHGLVTLSSGKVLVPGGSSNGTASAACYLYDPSANTWAATGSLNGARTLHGVSALSDGRVLVMGGQDAAAASMVTAEIYDPTTATWTYTGGLERGARYYPAAVLSPLSTKVLVAGGVSNQACEVWDPNAGISAANAGMFRVVRRLYDAGTSRWAFWVENSAAVEELAPISAIRFLDRNSVLPGDYLRIGIASSPIVGSWRVSRIHATDKQTFYLQSIGVSQAATALGAEYPLAQVIPGQAERLIKQILYVGVNPTDPTYTDIVVRSEKAADRISETNGTVLNALGKLDFPETVSVGQDGYHYNTGLIAEANRILYGVESDPAAYPGIIAAGAGLTIQGSVVKRVTVSIGVRTRSGIWADVKRRIQAEVAAVINRVGVGQAIPLVEIETAARSVPGVYSVIMLSPTNTSGSDLIVIQPSEKPMVLDLDQDVLVSLIGA